ncbi:hypothetical protein [Thermovirga lienii]|jgi:hypothetical protein|uniref:hypothetical protein n=1 Tax=Thermovirga lienii TaxID=336261 RepID=UPI002FE1DA44
MSSKTQGKMAKVNIIPLPWASVVIEKSLIKTMRKKNVSLLWVFGTVCVAVVVLSVGAWVWDTQIEKSSTRLLSAVHNQQQEQLAVIQNVQSYRSLTEFPNIVPVYVQWWGLNQMFDKQNIILTSATFNGTDTSVLPATMANSIAVETGQGLESLNVVGVWTADGRLAPDVGGVPSNTWLLECSRFLKDIFAPIGVNVYVDFLGQNSSVNDFTLAILLWQ